MGKLVKKIKAKKVKTPEDKYLVVLTQTEVDMIGGIVADLLDNPQRKVSMKYAVDQTDVIPSKKGRKALKGVAHAINKITQGPEYDYYDLWDDADFAEDVV